MKAAISGLGIWLPTQLRLNDAWPAEFTMNARAVGDRTLVDIPDEGLDSAALVTARHLKETAADPFIGATQRRIASDEDHAWSAEVSAARAALEDADVAASEVDAVLSWSIVPDRAAHATAPKVAAELGAHGAFALGADAGCASALIQLQLAAGLVESGSARHVLLTQSHLITRAFPMTHPASPGVGDCATAMLVSAAERPGVLGVHSVTHGEYWDSVTWIRGRDDASDTPWWKPGGPFFPGSRSPDGAKSLMGQTVHFGARTVEEALSRFRVEVDEVDAFACVQPRPWTPAAIAEVAGIDTDRAPNTYDRLAHVGGCGIVANLIEARDRGLLGDGALVALYAQGAGFTRSAAVVRWTNR